MALIQDPQGKEWLQNDKADGRVILLQMDDFLTDSADFSHILNQ